MCGDTTEFSLLPNAATFPPSSGRLLNNITTSAAITARLDSEMLL
jgi:hypothetical protein